MPCTCPAEIKDIRAYCCLSTVEAEFIRNVKVCENAAAATLAYIENNDTKLYENLTGAGDITYVKKWLNETEYLKLIRLAAEEHLDEMLDGPFIGQATRFVREWMKEELTVAQLAFNRKKVTPSSLCISFPFPCWEPIRSANTSLRNEAYSKFITVVKDAATTICEYNHRIFGYFPQFRIIKTDTDGLENDCEYDTLEVTFNINLSLNLNM
jgi:hypothetical protein